MQKEKETVQKEVQKDVAQTETEKKELPVAMIFKHPPHAYSVTMKTAKGVETFQFNSKEAMCVFLGARNF